jgi:hypothetical protein
MNGYATSGSLQRRVIFPSIVAFALLLLLLFSSCAPCRPTFEEELVLNGFSVALPQPEVEFPHSITFNLRARSEVPITRITLQYQVERLSLIPVTSVAFPEFEPATEVTTSWTWDMRKTGGLPPGARVKYWWSLEDERGRQKDTSPAIVSFEDQHHAWRNWTQGRLNLFWYEGEESFAAELLTAASQALERLARDTGVALEQPLNIYIYAGYQDLQEAMIYPQEWTGGVAFTEYSTVVLGISPDNLGWGKDAIAHELAHMLISLKTFSCSRVSPPTWLDEGLAMYAEGELNPGMSHILEQAIQEDSLISVRSLSSPFSAYAEQAYLSYAQSYSIVKFLIDTYGSDKMLELLERFRQGSGYDEALQQVYGFDTDGLDARWRQHIGAPPRPSAFLLPRRQLAPV